jgi:hypothetical protein
MGRAFLFTVKSTTIAFDVEETLLAVSAYVAIKREIFLCEVNINDERDF